MIIFCTEDCNGKQQIIEAKTCYKYENCNYIEKIIKTCLFSKMVSKL